MRVAILGGGGFRVPLIHRALLGSALAIDELVLYDVSSSRLAVMSAVLHGGGLAVRTTDDLDTAVDGTDIIFSALRVGGVDGRVSDERAALAAGVLGQETVGAGGLSYALRAVPIAERIARRTAERAPGAWTISMTNPAGIITEAMAATLGPRVIGVCDSPIALVRRACAALCIDAGPSLATVTDRVSADYLGLNHLGWLRSLSVDGTDLLPRLLADEAALLGMEEGRLFGPDLIQAIGTVPNEYLYWYYAQREALQGVLAAGRTRGEHVRAEQNAFYAAAAAAPEDASTLWAAANDERNRSYFAELRSDERDSADVTAGGYESIAVALAEALTGGPPANLILNVANGTTVAALAPDAIIETVCHADAGGITPLPARAPSEHELGLMSTIKACERAVIEAALTGSRAAALRAFALHPLVGSVGAARELSAQQPEPGGRGVGSARLP